MKPAQIAPSALVGALLFCSGPAGCIEHQPRPIVSEPTPTATQSEGTTDTPPPTPTAEGSGTPTHTPDVTPSATAGSPTPTVSPTPDPTPTAPPTPTPTLDPDLDYDGDGFSARQGDCQPFDARAHPGAVDLPFDGRDDNCNGVQDHVTTLVGARLNEGGGPDEVRMDSPWGLARAADGTIYYSDADQCRVRRIKDGVVTTVAGTGTCGFNGDGLPGPEAMLYNPLALALDETRGWLIIADRLNHRVRRLHLDTGILDTLAGTGSDGEPIEGAFATATSFEAPTALAIARESGEIFIGLIAGAGSSGSSVWRLDEVAAGLFQAHRVAGMLGYETACQGAEDGPALAASLCRVEGVDVSPDGQTVYITDWMLLDQAAIHRVEGGQLTSLIETDWYCTYPPPEPLPAESATLCQPMDIAFDDDGSIYYSSPGAGLSRLDADDDLVYWLAGDNAWRFDLPLGKPPYVEEGPAFDVTLGEPQGLQKAEDDWLLADALGGVIRRYAPGEPGFVSREAGVPAAGHRDGPLDEAILQQPFDIAVQPSTSDGGDVLYIADSLNGVVRKVEGGQVTTVAGIPGEGDFETPIADGSPALTTAIGIPLAVTVDEAGTVYILHREDQVLRLKDGLLTTVAGGGAIPSAEGDGQLATDVDLGVCDDVAVSPDGITLLIAEADSSLIRAVDVSSGSSGALRTFIGSGEIGPIEPNAPSLETPLSGPLGVQFQGGRVYVSSGADIARLNAGVMELLVTDQPHAQAIGFTGPTTLTDNYIGRFGVDQSGALFFNQEGQEAVFGMFPDDRHVRVVLGTLEHAYVSYNLDQGRADQIWIPNFYTAFASNSDGDLLVAVRGHSVIRQIRW